MKHEIGSQTQATKGSATAKPVSEMNAVELREVLWDQVQRGEITDAKYHSLVTARAKQDQANAGTKKCRCGHAKNKHYGGRGMCETYSAGYSSVCVCRRFRIATLA